MNTRRKDSGREYLNNLLATSTVLFCLNSKTRNWRSSPADLYTDLTYYQSDNLLCFLGVYWSNVWFCHISCCTGMTRMKRKVDYALLNSKVKKSVTASMWFYQTSENVSDGKLAYCAFAVKTGTRGKKLNKGQLPSIHNVGDEFNESREHCCQSRLRCTEGRRANTDTCLLLPKPQTWKNTF